MATVPSEQVTQLLVAWSKCDKEALDELMPLVYRELHRLARRRFVQEGAGHTLQTTALVHEAYLQHVRPIDVGHRVVAVELRRLSPRIPSTVVLDFEVAKSQKAGATTACVLSLSRPRKKRGRTLTAHPDTS